MPELPDVENFLTYFKANALHQTVSDVDVRDSSLFINKTGANAESILSGREFDSAERFGKFIVISLSGTDKQLVIHFGMTGRLAYAKPENFDDDEIEFAQMTVTFANGYQLRWINIRKFGKVYLVNHASDIDTIDSIGPEPLELERDEFISLARRHQRKNIKSFLMDQSDIAGIGNVYSNELLFQAGIDPHRRIKDIDDSELKKLHDSMVSVLEKAIDINVPEGDYPDSWLLAHEQDMKCPKNGHQLKKETIAGRSALYCPEHQS